MTRPSFFAVPYQVFFEDTMAYGTHHYLTNFRFQCVGRETLLFDVLPEARPGSRQELDDLILLTREGYTRNLAPVRLGEKVGILMTQEDRTRSSIRLCFRVVREDGVPVCCGYQTAVFVDKANYEVAPFPAGLGDFISSHAELTERLAGPTFAERCHVGGKHLKEMFTDEICALGKQVATSRGQASIVSDAPAVVAATPAPPAPLPAMSLAFTFPGQGSYDIKVLRELYANHPEKREYFTHADKVARDAWGYGFLALVLSATDEEHDAHLRQSPELDQLGIFLAAVIVGEVLIERGATPDVLVGHSFGELAALCVGGAYDAFTGCEMVIARVNALRDAAYGDGAMLAVSTGPARARELLDKIGMTAIDLGGVNLSSQVVLSGPRADIKRLADELPAHGAMGTVLKSRHPFHSRMLRPAVSLFENSLRRLTFGPLKTPVYSPIHGGLYPTNLDVASVLSSHFIRPFDFRATIEALHGAGVQTFVECAAGETLSRIIRKNLPSAPATVAQPSVPAGSNATDGIAAVATSLGLAPIVTESAGVDPIAIVSLGCVLPAARDANELWQNVGSGTSGIAELSVLDPMMAADFQSNGDVVPDKAYSLLAGIVRTIEADPRLPYSPDEFRLLTRGQRLLANALAQCVNDGATPIVSGPNGKRIHVLLGSTADGIKEYDEALAMRVVRDALASLDEAAPLKTAFSDVLDGIGEMEIGDADTLAPYPSYLSVLHRVLGPSAEMTLLDAACAASLYAIDVGMKMLAARETDLVIAGGVFAPGPGINVLFGQFKGLSATGCFPFDARADGVVFGEGAAVLALKRLSDAIAAGDRIYGVIRGVGLASDGKAASVNVPRSEGQALAMRRAYEKTGIDMNTIQYIEAHGTGTTVGDSTEFESLRTAFGDRRRDLAPIWVESVKGLTGHTGWVAGATSVIKVVRALQERRVPPHHVTTTHPSFAAKSESPLLIPTAPAAWPANLDGAPRRAGINGFGFGGTNAHLIIEEFDAVYHRRLAEKQILRLASPDIRMTEGLVVVAAGTLFPAPDGGVASQPDGRRHFERKSMRLPGKKRLLPDVTEHMDGGQYLAAMAADAALAGVPGWENFRNRIGIALGSTAKTVHGAAATSRVYVDRLKRGLAKGRGESDLTEPDFIRLSAELVSAISRGAQPSNPYTLIGFMPNVAAGRVSNLFDLQGANVVVDAGRGSLVAAIRLGRRMLAADDCDVVLAGAVQNTAVSHSRLDEGLPPDGVVLLALTTPEIAAARGLPAIGRLEIGAEHELRFTPAVHASGNGAGGAGNVDRVELNASQPSTTVPGLAEVARALQHVAATNTPAVVRFEATGPSRSSARPSRQSRRMTAMRRRNSLLARVSGAVDGSMVEAALVAAEEPVGFFTPALFDAPMPKTTPRVPSRPLYLVDQATVLASLRGLAGGLQIAAPALLGASGVFSVDLTSEDSIRASLASLDCSRFDAIIAIKDVGQSDADVLTPSSADSLLDLLFAVGRHAYPVIQRGDASLATICLRGVTGGLVHPYTGLAGGFMKSMARELPSSICKSLITDAADPVVALQQLANEIGVAQAGQPEVCYDGGTRRHFRLVPVPDVTVDRKPYIDQRSVVIATGGGRGVTALMAEELLQRFGCTVILLGRTDPSGMPQHVLEMDADRFKEYESEFYRETSTRDRTVKPAAMRRQYLSFGAGREIAGVVRRLATLPGRVEYRAVDVTNAADVERVIAEVAAKFGRIDLVMHGAGVQTSTRLDNRKLDDFRRTIDTKIGGLQHLYSACRRHVHNDVHFHLLTSAFSYIGNDGQPDYGAANEAMNRLAQQMNASGAGSYWTSLAWLAWDGIGMTRGSEYAVLVTERGLHGITADEGRSLFATLMAGRPSAAANILLTNAERRLLSVDVADDVQTARSGFEAGPTTVAGPSWRLDLDNAPYLRDHVVNGAPTLPGTFELALAVDAAAAVCPGRVVTGMENIVLSRFVKVVDGSPVNLRSVGQIVSETGSETVVRVALLSDFVHKSGAVLQKDIVHFEVDVRVAKAGIPLRGPVARWEPFTGRASVDPYMDPLAPVRLQGIFACLHDIVLGSERRRARFRVTQPQLLASLREFRVPPVLLDAMLRLTVVEADGVGTAPVFVPERIERIRAVSQRRIEQMHTNGEDIFLVAATPSVDHELLTARWVQALDSRGETLALVEFGTARRVDGQTLRDVSARPSLARRSSSVRVMT